MEFHTGKHDLRLPAWGPYTKKYAGISHVTDSDNGIRFDLSVFPGFYRRKIDVPNVLWESGFHPWEALADLSYYSFRHELEWKDRVYTDISYTALSERERLIRMECVNRTDTVQNIALHYMASLHYPQLGAHGPRLQEAEVRLPPRAVWIDALDYEELVFARARPSDNLVYDGFARGEERIQRFTRGSGLAAGFGRDPGDFVRYRIPLAQDMADAVVLLRYRMEAGSAVTVRMEGLSMAGKTATLKGDGEIRLFAIRVGPLPQARGELTIRSMGGGVLELDGFAVADNEAADAVRFEPVRRNPQPELRPGPQPGSLILQYEGAAVAYGLLWPHEQSEIRRFHASELDRFMRFTAHDHVSKTLSDGSQEGHFTNIFLRPIVLPPADSRVLYGLAVCGTPEEVWEKLSGRRGMGDTEAFEAAVRAKRASLLPDGLCSAGEPYLFSQQRMAATLLTNIVYPVYTKRTYIKHYTPGRWWDSLYTWDAGFIGIGLTELDPERAADCLNAYVTEPGDDQTAFIHHGSMVPVQFYLYLELWNKTLNREQLAYFYPRLRQYYLFYSGRAAGSSTNALRSDLLKTWDYFYNSGGWDDYPPQLHVHRQGLQKRAAPVSNTCHAIRIAKILVFAAQELGIPEAELAEYEADIAAFGSAVNRHAWDERSGYYGYVLHDEKGNPSGLMRHESGVNYNMGLDGAYPLVAGICAPDRGEAIVRHLNDPAGLWSPIGLTAVDRSAPYYSCDGYWNGTVWMAHQWFYWRTMLDCGLADEAWRIASTALNLWEAEVAETYHCFEHFIVSSGRGAGWHQFGGLSSPVLNWHAAYYRTGRVTAGFDVWVREARFAADNAHAELIWVHRPNAMGSAYTLLVGMNPAYAYTVTDGAAPVPHRRRHDGLLELRLEAGRRERNVAIRRIAAD